MTAYQLPEIHENTPQFLITGNVQGDLTLQFLKSAMPGPDSKGKADDFDFDLGGGAGNFIVVFHHLTQEYNIPSHIKSYTRIGKDDGTLKTKIPRMIVVERLAEYGIETIDVSQGVNAVPMAAVSEHRKGRSIWGGPNTQAKHLAKNVLAEIDNTTTRTLLTFIDPRKPLIGAHAAEGARKHDTLSMTDYGDKEWPSDDERLSELYDRILSSVDIAVVPSDARIKGMDKEDPEALINGLYERYQTPYILMTDAGNDAVAMIRGEKHIIPVEDYTGDKFTLAAGDSRNASFAFCLTLLKNAGELTPENMDNAILKAFKMATLMATEKIKHPGRSFVKHLDNLFQNHPLFADYQDQLTKPSVRKPANDIGQITNAHDDKLRHEI
jgi:sugar/nucleoside kinase (ribokinase family)